MLLCIVIIGFTILNNISFNAETLNKKSTELLKDSILLRQVEMQDLLLQKISVLDSMSLDNKSNSVIQEEILKIRDNSDEILKFQKKVYQKNNKE